jgi:hypothetical protein
MACLDDLARTVLLRLAKSDGLAGPACPGQALRLAGAGRPRNPGFACLSGILPRRGTPRGMVRIRAS